MANICKDRRRRCMSFDDWPQSDRAAWKTAIAQGSLLSDAGLAVRWRDGTRKRVMQSYGRFLTFFSNEGDLGDEEARANHITRDVVIAYATELQGQCAPVTVHGYVLNLERALSVMMPDVDWRWLKRIATRLKARARPSRNKRLKVVPIGDSMDLAIGLMNRALDAVDLRPKRRAVLYRDGLMIAILAERMLRRRNFVNLAIGRHLIRTDDCYQIMLAGSDTKNGRPYEAPLSDGLTPYLDIYLDKIRPILLCERNSDRLWITHAGTDMADSSFYITICKRTERELGRPINPHLFRDCATTSRAIDDPDNIRDMQPLLGHSSMRPIERHYNQAKAIDAARQFQRFIHGKRADTVAATRIRS